MSETESLVIAVLTYRRNEDLSALLPMLVEQAQSVDSRRFQVSVLIVDNDPAGGARDLVSSASVQYDLVPIRYEHEPIPGISAGRNHAISASLSDDLLVFIDDDERPSAKWLSLLLQCRDQFRSDVVQGPVVSEFGRELDEWIIAGGFFKRRRMPTGTALDVAVTNNLLLDLHVVRRLCLEFDPDLGTTGGEDSLFTRQLHRAGVPMVWCDEAIVFDVVPASRSTRTWVRQRAISMGNSTALVALKLASDPRRRTATQAMLAGKGAGRLAVGTLRSLAGRALRSTTHQARGTRTKLRGFGMLLGAFGFGWHEYGRKRRSRIERLPWR